MPLPSIGTLSYNGIVFDSAAKVRISSEYEKDGSGRTTTNIIIKLTVEALLVPSDDKSVNSLRARLGEQGKTLTYTDNAFPINVNNPYDGASVRDVAFGPSPRELAWRPLGGGTSGEIVWQCTTTIPACGHEPKGFALREFVYSVGFDINERGFTTRTISGYFKIPMSRLNPKMGSLGIGSRDIVETADSFREEVLKRFLLLTGHTRRSSFSLSEDKAKLSFTIVDTQIESNNAWPRDVTNIQMRHRIAWQPQNGGRATNHIHGTITMCEGRSASLALETWRSAVNARFRRVMCDDIKQVFIESMTAEEDLYGITHSFGLTYWIAGNPDKMPKDQQGGQGSGMVLTGERFIELCGFGEPMQDGNNWSPWSASRLKEGGPHGLRGTNGQKWESDHITDQCDGKPLSPLHSPPLLPTPPASTSSRSSVFLARCPKKAESWLEYKHTWTVEDLTRNLVTVRGLSKAELVAPRHDAGPGQPVITENTQQSPGSASNDQVLRRNLSNGNGQLWVIRGFARRACYEVPNFPDSIKLRDPKATLTLIRQAIERDVETNPLGLKLHRATFAAIYVTNRSLETPPPSVTYP